MYYTFQPLADLSQGHTGWFIWVALATTAIGITISAIVNHLKAGDNEGVGVLVVMIGVIGLITLLVYKESYTHTKPENIAYPATLQGYRGDKDTTLYVVYRLDANGHEILKEVRPDVAYPKHVILYKNKNKR